MENRIVRAGGRVDRKVRLLGAGPRARLLGPGESATAVDALVRTQELVDLRTIAIHAGERDVDTELDLFQGDRVVFSASGSIWSGVFGMGMNGPRGWNWIDEAPTFPLRGSNPFCLIGKIGVAEQYFYVGTGAERVADRAGPERLFLRTNDDAPGNGYGHFLCHVELWRPIKH